ncbi:tetratricopeptide repeat protein [Zunongwangia endophytica]|uniref:Tetratricopeptide repeat protein n=1 Tax=Zunongwangia endophytica TaxID=1808945 RepID=A0ABV8HFT3_9FLAO|nr:tetratricopeptide repeat protein [Zunongwangia endophytica]MDN3594105.1 tetratricopeptide repeat protein [Zunongwangia endophytica]
MKRNILTLSLLSFISLSAIAQKDEIKNAEDFIEDGNFDKAKTELATAEQKLSEANDKWTERFYLYKAQAYLADGSGVSVDDFKTAGDAYKKAVEMGSDDAQEGLANLRNQLVQSAIDDQNSENYKSAADKLVASYDLNKQDTIYLYYAAANSLNGQNYDDALKYYEQLRELNFDGASTQYTALNNETGERESMSKEQRELMMKTGNYSEPKDEKQPSKRGEIAKNIALIHIQEGNNDKAIEAMDDAKANNPDDLGLLQAEANMYYQMGDKEQYNQLMSELVKKNPNDANLYYNLGVSTAEIGDQDQAVEYYKKALEIDPDMDNARMNIAAVILSKERDIIEEMNGLGMSKEDNKRYEELSEERKEIYKEALPYLEATVEKNPENTDAIRTAMNIYTQVGNKEKAAEMKAMLEQ